MRRTFAPLLQAALGLCLLQATGTAQVLSGTLYFTTFQNQSGTVQALSPNVWKASYVYDSVAKVFCVGSSTLPCPAGDPVITNIAQLQGADGIILDPNDATNQTLLVGEQNTNQVAQLTTAGVVLFQKRPDGSKTVAQGNGQAYGLTATPDKTKLLMSPNDTGFGEFSINVSSLNPLTDGVAHAVSGPDAFLKGIAFMGNTAYYGDADDELLGHFGTLDISNPTFVTAEVGIVDLVDKGSPAGQGSLPSHGVSFDPYSGCFILSSGHMIWQLCPDPSLANTFDIVAKVSTISTCLHPTANPTCGQVNWDQITLDGQGHLFGANNDGDLLFIDYSGSATKSIGDSGNYSKLQFLAVALDDIATAPITSLPGRMTGGGSVFTASGQRVTHGFELHCDVNDVPNTLEINWGGNRFHLEQLTFADCFKDPSINAGHPTNTFNTYIGQGVGDYNGVPGAMASWTFTDAGEPGKNDMATITIVDAGGNTVLTVSGFLTSGNQQAHTDNK